VTSFVAFGRRLSIGYASMRLDAIFVCMGCGRGCEEMGMNPSCSCCIHKNRDFYFTHHDSVDLLSVRGCLNSGDGDGDQALAYYYYYYR